jgi:hypothetical protein
MTQIQHFWTAHRKNADINETFLYMVEHGLTADDLRKNIERRPSLWGRFSNWLDRLP